MKLCSMLCCNADGRGVWGRIDTCICMAESLCCSPETVATLLIGYIPKQHKDLNKISCERLYSFGLILLVYL